MPRFVVLFHQLPSDTERVSHWDLMLESSETLKTWALDELPSPGGVLPALALPDHRLAYLDYEGPISGGRGEVSRWDRGSLEWVRQDERCYIAQLRGDRLQVRVTLTAEAAGAVWILTCEELAAHGQE